MFLNLKNNKLTVDSYRFVDAAATTQADLMAAHRNETEECLTASVEKELVVVEVGKGNWSAQFTGIDGSDNFCFEEDAENLRAETEEEAIFQAELVWGL